jgi:hypothetical protein
MNTRNRLPGCDRSGRCLVRMAVASSPYSNGEHVTRSTLFKGRGRRLNSASVHLLVI